MREEIKISQYNYDLPEERIAKFPLDRREESKLLIYRDGNISHRQFFQIGSVLPEGAMLVFNNTKVIRARLVFYKDTGARIEIFCLEPHDPADYERAFAVKGSCEWCCMVGNLKKWKDGALNIDFEANGVQYRLSAELIGSYGSNQTVRFSWNGDMTFGQLLETLGRIPIPPYLCRESEQSDTERYQTVYSKFEGSVAAPTAGLHFTPELIEQLRSQGHSTAEVTLHVGAGTFLPVKSENAIEHTMHTEHFDITAGALRAIIASLGNIIAVGTTTVRTLESLVALGARALACGDPDADRVVGQWEIYDVAENITAAEALGALVSYMENNGLERLKAATQIMITSGYKFKIVDGIVTNFHQPQSTLLLLVSAMVGDNWHNIYDYALDNDFRFLSYGDSSILFR